LTDSTHCPVCSAIIYAGDRFCGECGSKLSNADSKSQSVVGTWLFPGTKTGVTFQENGEVSFSSEDDLSKEQWESDGKWEQIGRKILFDCNNFTIYDVELYGDRMIGFWYPTSGEVAGVRSRTVLEREGCDLSEQELPAFPALQDNHDDSYGSLLFRGFKHYFLADHDVNEIEQAKTIFEQAVEIDPERPEAYVGLGGCCFFLDDYEAALAYLYEANEKNFAFDARYELIRFEHIPDGADPNAPETYEIDFEWVILMQAELHYSLDQFDQAEEVLDCLFDQVSDNRAAFANQIRAKLCFERDNLNEALLHINKALAIDPDDANCRYIAGLVLFYKKDMKAAIEELSRALTLEPNHFDALLNRAKAYSAIGAKDKLEADIEALQQLIDDGYGDAELWEEFHQFVAELS